MGTGGMVGLDRACYMIYDRSICNIDVVKVSYCWNDLAELITDNQSTRPHRAKRRGNELFNSILPIWKVSVSRIHFNWLVVNRCKKYSRCQLFDRLHIFWSWSRPWNGMANRACTRSRLKFLKMPKQYFWWSCRYSHKIGLCKVFLERIGCARYLWHLIQIDDWCSIAQELQYGESNYIPSHVIHSKRILTLYLLTYLKLNYFVQEILPGDAECENSKHHCHDWQSVHIDAKDQYALNCGVPFRALWR